MLGRYFEVAMIIYAKILYCSLVYVNNHCLSCRLDLLLFSCSLKLNADFRPLGNSILYNFMGRSCSCSKRKLYVEIRPSFLVYTFFARFFSFFLPNEIFLGFFLIMWKSLNLILLISRWNFDITLFKLNSFVIFCKKLYFIKFNLIIIILNNTLI